MRSKQQSRQPTGRLVVAALVTITAVVALAVFLWPRSTKLSPDGYDLGVALYRVCNQKSDEGLKSIQERLSLIDESDDPGTVEALQPIVDEAESGNWKLAMERTRQVLDEQLQR